ncbi:MAG: biopolymer transporter ExbD [Treponema sp.]|jgi:biopolymer transport protein ExbD|nr:biopolymer transporter ExbD [Treponema sp.]
MTFTVKKSDTAGINITSLIDVIFLLVVFFMVSSTFDKPAFLVSLPQAASNDTVERPGISVAVDAAGNTWLEGSRIDGTALTQKLRELVGDNKDVAVSLDCDGKADFQSIALVMDAVKNAGIHRLAMRHEQAR